MVTAPPPDGQSPNGPEFGFLAEFAGEDETLQLMLNNIPAKVQQRWWKKYYPSSVRKTLEQCRDHYLAEKQTEHVKDISNWNVLIPAWIKREKKTLIERQKT